jgi:hypothetical protein
VLTSALREYFDAGPVATAEGYELYCRVIERRRGLFGAERLSVVALVILHGTEIDFCGYANAVVKAVTLGGHKPPRVSCTWLIASDHGGIYLHEAIDTKENRRQASLSSRFIVMNTGDGTVSFGPGHRDNGPASDRMRRLIGEYNAIPRDQWRRLFAQALDSFLA